MIASGRGIAYTSLLEFSDSSWRRCRNKTVCTVRSWAQNALQEVCCTGKTKFTCKFQVQVQEQKRRDVYQASHGKTEKNVCLLKPSFFGGWAVVVCCCQPKFPNHT